MIKFQDLNIEFRSTYFFILLLFIEAIFSAILLDPLIFSFPILILISIILFYNLFLSKPYLWVCMLVVGSGLDAWGQLFGGITVFHVTWGLTLLSFVFFNLFNKSEVIINTPINKFVYLYIGLAFVTFIYTPNVESAVVYLLTTLSLFLSYLVIINYLREKEHYKWVIYAFILVNTFISFLTFYQILFQNVLYFGRGTAEALSGEKIWRASGTFDDPNVAASFLVVGVLLTLSVIIFSKEKYYYKTLMLVSVLIGCGGIIATFSRSGWLTLGAGLVTLLLFQSDKKKLFYFLTSISILLFLFLLTPYSEFITGRFFSIFDITKDPSIRVRIFMALSGFWMFLDSPLLGIGYRGFPALYDYYIASGIPQMGLYIKESHTLAITLLAELGIVGFIIVFLWFKRIIVDNYRAIKNTEDPLLKSILIGTITIFISMNVNFLFYGNLFPHFNVIWIVWGVLYSIILHNVKLTA